MPSFIGMGAVAVVFVLGFTGAGPAVVRAAAPDHGDSGTTSLSNHQTTQRCDSCHQFESGFSHPTDIVPRMHVPESLPLEGGRVTCLTCHSSAAAKPHSEARSTPNPMLRRELSAENSCSACHQSSSSRGNAVHASEMVKAHLQAGSWSSPSRSSGLDSESQSCVSCHDGTIARDAGGHQVELGSSTGSADHPVGVPYNTRSVSSHADGIKLVSMGTLDRRVRLFDRAVGCGSCHSVYSGRDKLLVVPNLRSQLCLSCHIE